MTDSIEELLKDNISEKRVILNELRHIKNSVTKLEEFNGHTKICEARFRELEDFKTKTETVSKVGLIIVGGFSGLIGSIAGVLTALRVFGL